MCEPFPRYLAYAKAMLYQARQQNSQISPQAMSNVITKRKQLAHLKKEFMFFVLFEQTVSPLIIKGFWNQVLHRFWPNMFKEKVSFW
jgi:hypothetical protein